MISARGLQKAFGSVQAVRGIDLEVHPGQLLVLLGQNGAGKSTTLRMLGGVLRPDAGEIRFGDLRLPDGIDEVRRRLGVVPDQARLYGRNTPFEYLDHFGHLYGVDPGRRRRRIRELLERFELAAQQDQPMWTYSRGMAQKVALIRATLHDPDWIFCDEPTSGLDPVAAADMRAFLDEQRSRGAALIVTTHILGEAELMADSVAIMRRGRIVARGTLDELRRKSAAGRRWRAHLGAPLLQPRAIVRWLEQHASEVVLEGRALAFTLPWDWDEARAAGLAATLQTRLAAAGAPYFRLDEEAATLERIYLRAMAGDAPVAAEPEAAEKPEPAPSGIPVRRVLTSLRRQPGLLKQLLPFYVSSWWRRGDLSWVMWLNGFVLLLIAGASLFGSLPAGASIAGIGRGRLGAGLLLPLFFMSFALLESIKTSIGIWWEKAQGSLEVLLYTPLEDADLLWMEVVPGAAVSAVWIAGWMGAGLALLTWFGRPAPWALLPVFVLVATATAYWAAMGRMLGFLLFPREGAAGGAWSFLLSPVSAAVADLPLGLFVIGSPLAPYSLLLPAAACLVLTFLCASSFDRERLLETGITPRVRGRGDRLAALRRRWQPVLGVLVATALLAIAGAAISSVLGAHSWPGVAAALDGHRLAAPPSHTGAPLLSFRVASGVAVAAAVLAGITGALVLALALLALTFAAFFLLGLPELLLMAAAAALWGMQAGFGPDAPVAGWLEIGGAAVVLALALNTGAALPIYSALAFGAGRRLDRLRSAWREYFALYRLLVVPACGLFGLAVFLLLALG
ncbi:MAG TPA: ABC transporter ATP-binding protein [Candidatus Dormibacteraeota bacterium]